MRTNTRAHATLDLDLRSFLAKHWQKRPLVVRGALPEFRDPITPSDLFALASNASVESRLVRERGGAKAWSVAFGPFAKSQLRKLPARGWTLLVQDMNRYVRGCAGLLDHFAFLPNVRVDDVMVSYAAEGGGVGPHVDSYDVFLLQGLGSRRWRLHEKLTRDRECVRGLDLSILRRFVPDREAVLGPGDLLYVPPGFAHHGVAEGPCLTYSIGFRAPRVSELWTSFAEHLAATAPGAARLLSDPPLEPSKMPGAIPPAMLRDVRKAIRELQISDEMIDRWFATFATVVRAGQELAPPARKRSARAIASRLARGARVLRSEDAKYAILGRARGAWLYAGGLEIEVPAGAIALARLIQTRREFSGRDLLGVTTSADARALLTRLFAMGALAFESEREEEERDE